MNCYIFTSYYNDLNVNKHVYFFYYWKISLKKSSNNTKYEVNHFSETKFLSQVKSKKSILQQEIIKLVLTQHSRNFVKSSSLVCDDGDRKEEVCRRTKEKNKIQCKSINFCALRGGSKNFNRLVSRRSRLFWLSFSLSSIKK